MLGKDTEINFCRYGKYYQPSEMIIKVIIVHEKLIYINHIDLKTQTY